MKEVILNDECAHCKDKECHDGEHFCNQAMKENSFYKNAKLYKGLEVIKRPTYKELEQENAELKRRNAELKGMYAHSAREAETYKQFLESKEKENAELKSIADFQQSGNMSRYFELKRQGEQLTKAKEIIKDFLLMAKVERLKDRYETVEEAEQFLNSEVEK